MFMYVLTANSYIAQLFHCDWEYLADSDSLYLPAGWRCSLYCCHLLRNISTQQLSLRAQPSPQATWLGTSCLVSTVLPYDVTAGKCPYKEMCEILAGPTTGHCWGEQNYQSAPFGARQHNPGQGVKDIHDSTQTLPGMKKKLIDNCNREFSSHDHEQNSIFW